MSSNNGNGLVVLEVPARLSWTEWSDRVHAIGGLRKKLPWYVGDLVLYGEATFHEKASQLLNEFGYNERQLSQYRYVAKKFPVEDRCDLPWSWHQAAAALPKRERDKALTAALAGELNRSAIRALANGKTHEPTPELPTSSLLIDALLMVGKLLSREAKGENVSDLLRPALDEMISEAMAKLASLQGKA